MESLNNVNTRTTLSTGKPHTSLIKKVEESKTQDPKQTAGKAPSALSKAGLSIVKQQPAKKVEEAKQSEIEKNLESEVYNGGECNICMCIMVEPVVLPCKHVYCGQCALLFLTKKHECPLDRKAVPKNYKPKVDEDMQKKIRILKPKEFAAMEKEIRKGQGLIGDQVEIEFEIGNRYEALKKFKTSGAKGEYEFKHSWSLYVKPLDEKIRAKQHLIIKEVKLELHPTFRQPIRWLKDIKANKPIELANIISWGSFEIDVTIFWTTKTGQQIPFSLSHDLVFRTGGAKKTYKVKFDKTKLNPLLEPAKKA